MKHPNERHWYNNKKAWGALTTVVLDEAQLWELDGHLHVDVVEARGQGPQLLAQAVRQVVVLHHQRGVRVGHPQLNAPRYHRWNGEGKPATITTLDVAGYLDTWWVGFVLQYTTKGLIRDKQNILLLLVSTVLIQCL